MPVLQLTSLEIINNTKKSVLFFWADWHEPSKVGGQMHSIVDGLSLKYGDIDFYTVEAEAVPEVSQSFEVSVVPTFITISGTKVLEKKEGANPAEIAALVSTLNQAAVETGTSAATKTDITARLKTLINTAPVMLFMKGSPNEPRCGFSRKIVEILKTAEIPFASFDILTDEEVRAGLKTYSDWPTYPQLYVNGEFSGGLDIVKEMAEGGNLKEQLGVTDLTLPPAPPSLEEKLKSLVNQAPVMIFVKGSPDQPRCGFSKTIMQIFKDQEIEFSTFDILDDEEVRAGLKTYSDWPTYPQVYVNGEFVGGLDIIKEMAEGGSLKEQLGIAN